ncbi:MAG: response regulator [Gammaproteobacteria bacterium]
MALPGSASVFRLFSPAPISPTDPDVVAGPDDHAGVGLDRPELRILLIEDSEPIKVRLTALLTVPGTMRVVAAAATEAEARTQIEAAAYDVLLVDVELREGSGIGAIRHARRFYPPGRQPLIVVLTNYPLPAVRSRCLQAGADHFLDKMHQFQDVKALISTAPRLARD